MYPLFKLTSSKGLAFLALLFLIYCTPAKAQQSILQGANSLQAHFQGTTKPLSELAPMPGSSRAKQMARKANKPNFMPPNFINYRRQPIANPHGLPVGNDPIRQSNQSRSVNRIVEPSLVIEGINENSANAGVPDTNGEISQDHYIQIINASFFRIFDREGTPLTPVTSANTLWNQIGMESFSDPIIMYDEAADRWLLTDLANINVILYGVSATSDPLGEWNLYTLNTPGFADYPKYGIWPGAYIFTINEGQDAYPVYALNRQQMLDGENDIDVQRIEIPGINGGFPTATPMDWNSPAPPPTDEVFVLRINDDSWGNGNESDQLEVWSIDIDWETAANTTTSSTFLPTAPFDSDGCSINNGGFACIPQPGTAQGIDGIMTVIMNNIAYWNYGTHESAVLTFSVDAGDDVAGIRWMEIRRTNETDWTIYQEGTFAPEDGVHRFIGSIAINGNGDIGLAYSVSSENTFPSLCYTGRGADDPLGEMTVKEYEFATGLSARSGDRFGDYAKMSVDPTDDSFWFTGEYMLEEGEFGTKIVNFIIRKDTLDLSATAIESPQNADDLSDSEMVRMHIKNIGLDTATNFSVGYIFEDNAAIIENATIDTLLPDSIYMHTFSSTVDMSTIGAYDLKVFSIFDEDQNMRNDTLHQTIKKLARFDAAITDIEGIGIQICDSTIVASIEVTNFGTETLSSATIEYQLNSGAIQTIDWTGSLANGERELIDVLLSPLQNGTNTLSIQVATPNETPDEIPVNDHLEKDFDVLLDGRITTLRLTLDDYPEETSWSLQNSQGAMLYEGGTYPDQENEILIENWCLDEEECYTFIINDIYGDGMTSFNGSTGTYSIEDEDGNAYTSIMQNNFGFQEMNDFCLVLPCNVSATFDVTDAATAASADGAVLVTPTSGISPFTYSIDGGETTQEAPLFDQLMAGEYQIMVIDVNGCTYEEVVVVDVIVSTYTLPHTHQITIAPNPSKNGAFWVKLEGIEGNHPQLDLQIVDAIGRPVLYESLPAIDGHYSGLVSLANFPSGVYYIRFKNEDINQLVKIVRL